MCRIAYVWTLFLCKTVKFQGVFVRNVHVVIHPKLPKLKSRKKRKIITVLSLRKAGLLGALLGCDAHEAKRSWRVPFPAA